MLMGKVTTSQGGSLTLREIKAKYGLPANAAKVQIDQLYPNVKPVRLNGLADSARFLYKVLHRVSSRTL